MNQADADRIIAREASEVLDGWFANRRTAYWDGLADARTSAAEEEQLRGAAARFCRAAERLCSQMEEETSTCSDHDDVIGMDPHQINGLRG